LQLFLHTNPQFKDKSQKLAWQLWFRKYMVLFILVLVVVLFLYLRFF